MRLVNKHVVVERQNESRPIRTAVTRCRVMSDVDDIIYTVSQKNPQTIGHCKSKRCEIFHRVV